MSRPTRSPGRPHHHQLNALSPLQGLSPLPPSIDNLFGAQAAASDAATPSDDLAASPASYAASPQASPDPSRSPATPALRRAPSLHERVFSTGSVRRRSSASENSPSGITTRLILVKAPADDPQAPAQ